MSRKPKEFYKYIIETDITHISQQDYTESPATAFLNYSLDAKDAIIACTNHFARDNANKTFTNPALHSIQHISAALLPSVMGHFEMFQKYLFAGVFELTLYFEKFDIKSFFKDLTGKRGNDEKPLNIDLFNLSSYRGLKAPVGLVIADSLKNWHDPNEVNKYFMSFTPKNNNFNPQTIFSNEDIAKLRVLWQLRHSIVHTAGTITIPDSHKIPELKAFGGKNIVLDNSFIREVSKKFHPLIKGSVERLESNINKQLKSDLPTEIQEKKSKLFIVHSKYNTWF